jgi:hypothetical protein
MERVCAWCKNHLGTVSDQSADNQVITHGICETCAQWFLTNSNENLRDFLDRLGVPVLVIESNIRVWTANKYACELLGKELPEMDGCRPGNVIECAYAKKPGGCGQQVHCKTCAIRNTVQETFATGRSLTGVKAYPDVQLGAEQKTLSLEISTEKIAGLVLLRIDRLKVKE